MPEKHSKKNRKNKEVFSEGRRDYLLKAMDRLIEDLVFDRIQLSKQKQKNTLINQFIFKIKSIFKLDQPKESDDNKLIGRIHELNKNANEVLKVLNLVREDLKKEVDEELYSFVEAVMNPMIRDIARVQKIVKKEGAIHSQIDAFHKYNEWIDKAKMWVSICSTAKNKEAISKVIIQHTFSDFVALVNKDLKLIEDYQQHVLDDLNIPLEQKLLLKEDIQKAVEFPLQSMDGLKIRPKHLDLENLNGWKEQAEKRRDRCFNMVLQIIDNKASFLNPLKSQKGEHDATVAIFEQVSYLEMEISMLVEKLGEGSNGSFEKEVTLQQLAALQQEVYDLYHNITMPQAIIERLQNLNELLKQTFSKY